MSKVIRKLENIVSNRTRFIRITNGKGDSRESEEVGNAFHFLFGQFFRRLVREIHSHSGL